MRKQRDLIEKRGRQAACWTEGTALTVCSGKLVEGKGGSTTYTLRQTKMPVLWDIKTAMPRLRLDNCRAYFETTPLDTVESKKLLKFEDESRDSNNNNS